MTGTDCFDGKTLEMLVKLAQKQPRDLTHERFTDIVQKKQLGTFLSAMTNPQLFDRLITVINGEAVVSYAPSKTLRLWSSGRTGEEWIDFFEGKVSPGAKHVLKSKSFVPERSKVRYEVEFAPGRLQPDGLPTPHGVRFGAQQKEPIEVPLEVACLLRERMEDERIQDIVKWAGGWEGIVFVHKTKNLKESDRYLVLKTDQRLSLAAYHTGISSNSYAFAYCTLVRQQ